MWEPLTNLGNHQPIWRTACVGEMSLTNRRPSPVPPEFIEGQEDGNQIHLSKAPQCGHRSRDETLLRKDQAVQMR